MINFVFLLGLFLFSQLSFAGTKIKMYCPDKKGCFNVVDVLSEEAAKDREALGCQRADGTSPKPENKKPAPKSNVRSRT